MRKIVQLFAIVLSLPFMAYTAAGQTLPQDIKSKGTYTHKSTKTEFPEKFEGFKRNRLMYFNDDKQHLGVTYFDDSGECWTTVYLIPNAEGSRGRLRDHFLGSLNAIMLMQGAKKAEVKTKYLRHDDGEYICNGFTGSLESDSWLNKVTVYECGTWLLKLRTTTPVSDTAKMNDFEKKMVDYINPSSLTALNPLNHEKEPIISVDTKSSVDSIMFVCSMGRAMTELAWAGEKADSREKASGFPDLHIEMTIWGIKMFIMFYDKCNDETTGNETKRYAEELKSVIEAGFLNEFIMDQHKMIMLVPDDMKLDFDAYFEWKEKNPIKNVDLTAIPFSLSYSPTK